MTALDANGTQVDPAAIRPSPAHRGSPRGTTWRNPTVWLFVLFLVLLAGSFTYLWGVVPAWAAIVLGTLGRYVGFTVMHESSHRVAHRNRRINELLGWPTGLALSTALPVFRTVHTKHHSSTNQPGLDPDMEVARSPRWLRPLWLLSPLWTYRGHYFRQGWAKRRGHRWAQLAIDAGIVAMAIAAVATGHTLEFVVLIVAPTLLAIGFLGFAFDLLPHLPYDSTERFHDTRALPSRVLNVLLLGQNYHLIHHLWNTVPWYKYQVVYGETRTDLDAIGARVNWGD